MNCIKQCKYFLNIGTLSGVCSYCESYFPITLGEHCPFTYEEYKCKDCMHFQEHDSACMTAEAGDSAKNCAGFEDVKYYNLLSILFEWRNRGINYHNLIDKALSEIENREIID